jgi:anionic cell wall polymer biosynthesis LytR-Cps2A-Psr (LCP) family protein
VKEGGTSVSATQAGVNALRTLLTTGFNIPIDYSVNLSEEQLSDLIQEINNVPITLPKAMGGFAAGHHTLTAQTAMDFLTYTQYDDPVNDKLLAHMQFASAFWQQARTVITAENLSLYSMEIRGMMTTDIPNTGGEDMFFLRRFLRAEPDAFRLTHVTTKSVYYSGAQCHVLIKNNALEQLNQQMLVYKEPLTTEQFDPSGVFVDYANQMVATVYTTSTPLPTLHTMAKLLNLDPPPQTGEGDSET